mgnify:CR=1 FL=1
MKSKRRQSEGRAHSRAFLRIIDANTNRAKEALRVCEDLARLLMNNGRLAAAYKRTRHQLTHLLSDFPASYFELLRARDSARDVGRRHLIQDTAARPKWQGLMIANMKRAQEALRVLEEVSKAVSPSAARRFSKLRFRLYELEKKSVREF